MCVFDDRYERNAASTEISMILKALKAKRRYLIVIKHLV